MSTRARLSFDQLEDRTTPATGMIAVGSGPTVEAQVQVYDNLTSALRFTVNPFPGFTGGVNVASGDVNGDGVEDLIVAPAAGGGPIVSVYNGSDGSLLASGLVYEESFRGGVNVSAGDFNNDGTDELVIGSGVGGGPRVRILDGLSFSVFREAMVYEASFRGGVNVAAGDITGDGIADVATSTGDGGGPRVVILNGTNFAQVASFFVFDPTSRTGFNIALGEVNGDNRADIAVGAGAGAPAQVRVFSGRNLQLVSDFFVSNTFNTPTLIPYISGDAGVRLAVADVNGDQIGDIITAKGPGSQPIVRLYQITAVNPITNALIPTLVELRDIAAFGPSYGAGLTVAASS